jgi:hypothetical protein
VWFIGNPQKSITSPLFYLPAEGVVLPAYRSKPPLSVKIHIPAR